MTEVKSIGALSCRANCEFIDNKYNNVIRPCVQKIEEGEEICKINIENYFRQGKVVVTELKANKKSHRVDVLSNKIDVGQVANGTATVIYDASALRLPNQSQT